MVHRGGHDRLHDLVAAAGLDPDPASIGAPADQRSY
jgi:hypothetical protein